MTMTNFSISILRTSLDLFDLVENYELELNCDTLLMIQYTKVSTQVLKQDRILLKCVLLLYGDNFLVVS